MDVKLKCQSKTLHSDAKFKKLGKNTHECKWRRSVFNIRSFLWKEIKIALMESFKLHFLCVYDYVFLEYK